MASRLRRREKLQSRLSSMSRLVGRPVLRPAVETSLILRDGVDPRCPGRRPTVLYGRSPIPRLRGKVPSVRGTSAFDPYPSRLETRTKESSMCASHWVYET